MLKKNNIYLSSPLCPSFLTAVCYITTIFLSPLLYKRFSCWKQFVRLIKCKELIFLSVTFFFLWRPQHIENCRCQVRRIRWVQFFKVQQSLFCCVMIEDVTYSICQILLLFLHRRNETGESFGIGFCNY